MATETVSHEPKTSPTSGPWRVEYFGKSESANARIQPAAGIAPGGSLADVYGNRANARLIAAAPELLRALQNVESYFYDSRMTADVFDALVADVRRVVAKAKGR